ncbi:hypothetical protein NM688_g2707 [Phlebia brevispora]|uniref:Uncharacterized protein n=1 Tax=Phlebia brevispora TaxID=194682 RepID=A0ACC1T7U1_9APHY|nr:hypothetical protein NM688_g2707 [Phlebia brevispora]
MEDLFLQVECDSDVFVQNGSTIDSTEHMIGALIPDTWYRFGWRPFAEDGSVPTGAAETWRECTNSADDMRCMPIFHKVHHRTVFRGQGSPLHKVTDLRDVFRILANTSAALEIMHNAGWLHRNLSLQSTWVDQECQVRLSDLESAKRMDNTAPPHPGRVFAKEFVALEVSSQKYCFDPTQFEKEAIFDPVVADEASPNEASPDEAAPDEAVLDEAVTEKVVPYNVVPGEATLDEAASYEVVSDERLWGCDLLKIESSEFDAEEYQRSRMLLLGLKPPPCWSFRYNPLHDLESLFWIVVYFFFMRHIAADGAPCIRTDEMNKTAQDVFRHTPLARGNLLRSVVDFQHALQLLDPRLQPICQELDVLRQALCKAYKAVEGRAYSAAAQGFRRIARRLKDASYTVHPAEESSSDPQIFVAPALLGVDVNVSRDAPASELDVRTPPRTPARKRTNSQPDRDSREIKKTRSSRH